MKNNPIFIHSLFRAGSTYLFKRFRGLGDGYCAYQEPLHEITVACRNNPDGLNEDHGEAKAIVLRHPNLGSGYFSELVAAWPAWKDKITEELVYCGYFATEENKAGIPFWKSLIQATKGRPVFQECRTSGRIKVIKSKLGGQHIYLWRNPWDQWWSYKINNYFNAAAQLIIHADNPPAPVSLMLQELNLAKYFQHDLGHAFAFYFDRPLTSEQSYLVFYMLWCLGLLEGVENADFLLNIDQLSSSEKYQKAMCEKLAAIQVDGIDFSDCQVPQGYYSKDQQTFFAAAESRVHLWLIEGGWHQEDLEKILKLRKQFQPTIHAEPVNKIDQLKLIEQVHRFEEMARRFETALAKNSQKLIAVREESQIQITQAHQSANAANELAERAEQKSREAELRAAQAELLATQQITELTQALEATKHELNQTHQANHHHWQIAELRQEQINALYNSRSWRITAPLRWPVNQIHLLMQHGLRKRFKAFIKKILRKINRTLLARPKLRYRLIRLSKTIGLYNTLKKIQNKLREGPQTQSVMCTRVQVLCNEEARELNLQQLSPRAREIYRELKQAIERNKLEKN